MEYVAAFREKRYTKKEALDAEIARTKRMYLFEEKYSDFPYVCGIDEVGRGPLAGPVCAGAVILPKDKFILYLNDSKQLTEKKREKLYDVIREHALAYATAFVSGARIDEINILQATYEAMAMAVRSLEETYRIRPDALLIDAVHVPQLEAYKQVSIVKGDAQCASIAAASILAKVDRDRLMAGFDAQYPGYGFISHKGYGTAAHIEAIRTKGPSPIHRRTFITRLV
ncbi:MAG: ribonuclease HII [Lachnospiraceae bacterium]|nr:ribonuclease HII [Lachnospiraceae bacterium]